MECIRRFPIATSARPRSRGPRSNEGARFGCRAELLHEAGARHGAWRRAGSVPRGRRATRWFESIAITRSYVDARARLTRARGTGRLVRGPLIWGVRRHPVARRSPIAERRARRDLDTSAGTAAR